MAQAQALKGPHAWSGVCICLQNPIPIEVKDDAGNVIDTLPAGSLRRNSKCPLHGLFGDANIRREHASGQNPEGWDKPERALREAIELELVDDDEAVRRALDDGLVDEKDAEAFRASLGAVRSEGATFRAAVERGDVDDPT